MTGQKGIRRSLLSFCEIPNRISQVRDILTILLLLLLLGYVTIFTKLQFILRGLRWY